MQGMETAYVGNGISAENVSTAVGTEVIKAVAQKYQTNNQIGKATIEIDGFGTLEEVIGDATVTVSTTDFEVEGTITLNDGVLTWGDILPNVPSIVLTAEGSTKVAPNGTLQLGANFRKMASIPLANLTWTSSNTSVATISNSGLVTVKPDAQDGQTVNITALGNGVTSSPFTIIVKDLPSVSKYRTLTRNSTTGVIVVNSNSNETIYDDNNKPVIIPAGFGIALDSGTKIEEGIVIEDVISTNAKKGSQFVWVPVDTTVSYSTGTNGYVNSAQQTSLANADSTLETVGATTGTIKLSRYDFGEKANSTSVSSLIPKGAQDEIKKGTSYATEDKEGFTKQVDENTTRTYQASVARDIDEFISKTNSAKGFYIGRYEMGKESSTDSTAVCKSGKIIYTDVKRSKESSDTTDQALELSQNMYGYQAGKYASDLINSFAWDTTIAFIEKCGTNSNFAFQYAGGSISVTNSGGEECKIFSMAGNVFEFSTEICSNTSYPCVARGGYCNNSAFYTSTRTGYGNSESSNQVGFRPIIYIL